MEASPVLPVTPAVGPVAVKVQSARPAEPPLSLVTVFARVSVAARSLLVTVQVAFTPFPIVKRLPTSEPAEQTQPSKVYPAISDSVRVYCPAVIGTLVTEAVPEIPLKVVGPVAVSVHILAARLPPLSLVTDLSKVSVAA